MTEPIKTWYALDIVIERAASEAAEVALNALDCLGIEIDSLGKVDSSDRTVTGFFDSRPDERAVSIELKEALRIYGFDRSAVRSVTARDVEQTDWLAEWKKHWRPTEAGMFVIRAPWHDGSADNKIDISIEPNMAFGTGTHETTRLCLEAISNISKRSFSFLDVGTGTGILSIAAAKIGGRPINAFDTDRDSVSIARDNAALNGVGDAISFFEGPVSDETAPADVVAANLTLDVILPILPELARLAEKMLLLSGILAEQRLQINDALAGLGHHDHDIRELGEWISVVVNMDGS